jgi:hypothetical protein
MSLRSKVPPTQIVDLMAHIDAHMDAKLDAKFEALTQTVIAQTRRPELASFTILQFCDRHQISESTYHKLRREKRGPRVLSIGTDGIRISRQAELDWIREREAEGEIQTHAPRAPSGARLRPTNSPSSEAGEASVNH